MAVKTLLKEDQDSGLQAFLLPRFSVNTLLSSHRTNADEGSPLSQKRVRHEVSFSEQLLLTSVLCKSDLVSIHFLVLSYTLMRFRGQKACHRFSGWRARRVWSRGQTMTAWLQKASTVHHMVKWIHIFSVTEWYYEDSVFTPTSHSSTIRHGLPVQPVSIAPAPQRRLQPRQLEPPSHTANANGWGAAIGSDGVTWSGWEAQPRVSGNSLHRWLFR